MSTKPKKVLLNAYMNKHKSCGKCQKRWKGMKQRFNLNEAPQFLVNKAKSSGDLKDLVNMLWENK
jgi:hypothetical protein